jgi:cytochrome c oxidase assembly protein subunit 11
MPASQRPPSARRGTTVALLLAVVAGMVGLSFASVPLYRIFCSATGYEGTTERAARAPGKESNRFITVRFDSETAPGLGWRFAPEQHEIKVHPGEQYQAFYRAVNQNPTAVVGRAVYNVTPFKAGPYFDKIQCFCFSNQRLGPGESADMGVVFFVDPRILKDPNTSDVTTITLSYTMFRAADQKAPSAAAAAPTRTSQLTRSKAP